MSSGTQLELDWVATDAPAVGELRGAGAAPTAVPNAAADARYLTDEEILEIESTAPTAPNNRFVIPSEARNLSAGFAEHHENRQRDSSGQNSPRNDSAQGTAETTAAENRQAEACPTEMPMWMQAAAADPRHSGEAQQLWREHQEFRAAFASPEEARAIKELLPGGVRDVLSLREATQSVERIDAALFSGDARAQSEVVAELARANPAAFRSLFAEAAKVLAGLGAGGRGPGILEAGGRKLELGNHQSIVIPSEARNFSSIENGSGKPAQRDSSGENRPRNDNVVEVARDTLRPPQADSGRAGHGPRAANHESQITNHDFDPAAYAAFERSTNDSVARDVRGSISDTLARALPEGMADGAARRISEDIFQEIHRALSSDRTLSEQVAAVLRERRFGSAEQQQVSSLLAGRARQLVPSVARRVIGEWTSSVLNTSRSKAARQAAAASRVDIAAPGGSLDSMPLRSSAAGARGVDYASMTDEQILGI